MPSSTPSTEPTPRSSTAANLSVALAVGCCVAAATYAISRAVQAFFFPSPDPRTVLTVGPIAFFWRAQVAAYAGSMAAVVASALRKRAPAHFDRALPTLFAVVVLVVTVQGLFIP